MKIKGDKEKWIKKRLVNTSIVFRSPDVYFKEFDINKKRMLNDMGKIIQKLDRLYLLYEHSDEEGKFKIRKQIADLENYIQKLEVKGEK